MMKKWSKIAVACLLMICIQIPAFAEFAWKPLEQPEFIKQYSVEELLVLRELIDAELEARGYQCAPMETYILNTNTVKFHLPSCKSVDKIKESNRKEYTGSREEVLVFGYSPCGNCHP